MDQPRVLISREQIADKVREIGDRISQDFAGEPVILIGVLKGRRFFSRPGPPNHTRHSAFDFIAVSSYGSAKHHSGEVRLVKDVDQAVDGKNVVLVEDILDTGLTLSYLKNLFRARCPKELKVAVLLDKPSRRIQPVQVDYVGFQIPDEFVVGYGLDFAERYRNLSDVCVLESN